MMWWHPFFDQKSLFFDWDSQVFFLLENQFSFSWNLLAKSDLPREGF